MKTWLVLSIILFLSSCSTTHIPENNIHLNMGMSTSEFMDIGIDVDDYALSGQSFNKGNYIIYQTDIHRTVEATTTYYYLFKDDKLYYWGYPYKFIKHEDPIIRAAVKEANKYFLD